MFFNTDAHLYGRATRLDAAHALIISVRPRPLVGWYGRLKVLFDFSLALLLLAVSAPVVLAACLAVKLTSPGPMFYFQTRLGRRGRPYTIYKVRTMTHGCELKSGACWAKVDDPRVTPIGKVLRRLHIDELPQLWNVIRCEMSLVGPRPERPEFLPSLIEVLPRYRERLRVRPGVTGLAQIQLPADSDIESVRRKLAYDVYYVNHVSFWLDCRIVLATAAYLLGLPFTVWRALFSIPSGEPVERAFSDAPSQATPAAVMNAELNPA